MNLEMFRNTPPQESLAEPRFVDEATLLSARPVIPIAALEAKSRLRQHLTLFLAVITSMLFGAGAAALIVHLEHGNEGRTTQVESIPAEAQGSSASPSQADASTSAGGNTASIESSVLGLAGNTERTRTGRKQIGFSDSRNRQPTTNTSAIKRVMQEQPQTEQRQRRVSDTQDVVRSRKSRAQDDLFRVQEIFEGPAKP
jgi:hypothetical protein